MSPRPRKRGRRGWPENLYGQTKGGATYYSYRHPLTGARHGMGTDFAKAAQAARLLNAQLMSAHGVEDLVRDITAGTVLLHDYLARYSAEVLPAHTDRRGNPYATKTLEDYQRRLVIVQREPFASRAVHEVTRRDIAEFLAAQRGGRSANIYRQLLKQVFARALAEGLCEDNPVTATLERVVVVQRQRLPYPVFQAIRAAAEPWFRNALDLAVQTLQRREDITRMRFEHIQDGRLLVRQSKVEHHDTGNVRIAIGPALGAVIERCRDDLLSPFLLHRRPIRRTRGHMNEREHWTQLRPEQLTRAFHDLRDELGLCADLAPEARPSFHEIRAMGADLYRKAGVPDAEIQKLLGHSSEKMTGVYLDRHGERWVDAVAGLDA